MSIYEMMTRKDFEKLRERYLASVRVAEENNRKGIVFKNGEDPLTEGRRSVIAALLDKNYRSKKFKDER